MVTHQPSLLHDTIEEALGDVLHALGGPKAVAAELWPSKNLQDGARYLRHCLNEDRAEKLALHEVMWLLKAGARAGCHVAMHFINRECGYAKPEPVNPEDEKAKLQREFKASVTQLSTLAARIERLG